MFEANPLNGCPHRQRRFQLAAEIACVALSTRHGSTLLEATCPVSRKSTDMGNRDDEYLVRIDEVDDRVWEAAEDVPADLLGGLSRHAPRRRVDARLLVAHSVKAPGRIS